LEFQLTIEDGSFLIKLARQAIENFLKSSEVIKVPVDTPPKLMEKRGVFVTLNKAKPTRELRGCIGYPLPAAPLAEAVINSAIESATNDPRFPPVSIDELDEIVIEVSVLTLPELITVKDQTEYPKKIVVGRDGLIVEEGFYKGLLLPQVPVEWNWDEEEFLCNCCLKAGLPPDCWLRKGVKIYKFQAIIFEEKSPRGKVELKSLQGGK
jgi:uncharacterized protein (TIGR00296 family)